jgi:hypothetical protein
MKGPPLDIVKEFSKNAFFRIFFYLMLLGVLVFMTLFYGIHYLWITLSGIEGIVNNPIVAARLNELMGVAKSALFSYAIPAIVIVFGFTGFAVWLGLRGNLQRRLSESGKQPVRKTAPKLADSAVDEAQKRRQDKQLFLYLLSLLQREGRLIDFFAEDLTLYEDAQIGAAVRGVHESCKKVIEKNLSPKPIIDEEEGKEITVNAGFDPAAIKLIGNVSGDPPFKGVLRHRGWQSKKEDLPSLSGTRDAGILAPAEVELQS